LEKKGNFMNFQVTVNKASRKVKTYRKTCTSAHSQ
jgi:hypothetical protein